MEEGDQLVAGTRERFLMDELYTCVGSLFKLAFNVVRAKRDMVNASTWIFFQEFRDRAFRVGRFKQFQMDLADSEKSSAHLLRRHFLAVFAFKSKGFFIIRYSLVQRSYRDSKMIDFPKHNLDASCTFRLIVRCQ